MTFWQGGSTNPIYLCNDHAKALAPNQTPVKEQHAELKSA
jgi:hypothetical protein